MLLVAAAYACPTVVNGTPDALNFDVAQAVVVRQGQRTTFTVSINPFGEGQGFALVMPVPEVLEEGAVRTIEGDLFRQLDAFTAPRRVTDAGCTPPAPSESDTDTDTDADVDADGGTADVDIEAEYLVGDYAITILSADESTALDDWLDDHGYHLAPGAEPILAEYIDAGSYFMAAKVADGAALANGTALPPLQMTYQSPTFGIPIRLATLNSPGEQDLVVYTITEAHDGEIAVSNYPEFQVPETCRWGDPDVDDFGSFYEGIYTEAWASVGDAAWAVEYSGTSSSCSPCSTVPLDGYQLVDLGFVGGRDRAWLTRIHMRYTPEQAYEDLSFYATDIQSMTTLSYADDVAGNDCIDACFPEPDADPEPDCGCDTGAGPVGLTFLLGAGLLARRRSALAR